MAIRIVKKDDKGLYFSVEGYKARFNSYLSARKKTCYAQDDKVNVRWSMGRGGGMAHLDNGEAWYISYDY